MPEKPHSTTHDLPMGEESPRFSSASVGSSDRSSTATLSDCSDFPDVQRPVSVVSTISSGSGSSREDVPLSGISSADVSIEDSVKLELIPAGNLRDTQDINLVQESGLYFRTNSSNALNNNKSFSPFAAKAMAPNPALSYLDRVVMEIIETERMYVRDLRSIVEDYLSQIIDAGDLPIGPEQVCALFGNIEDIYEFNSELLQSLDMCDNDPVAVARCFVLKREYFDIYTQYCTNYPNSVAALTDCMRNKTLAKFFRERQAALNRSLPLGSFLLKPVQRILKYHLLLQEIAKHFDQEEEGYEVVEEAIYTMTGVAWYINDMKRKHEHAVRLQEVQSLLINWKGPDLTTYGELVLEGSFRVHRAKNERTLFLFERVLLITKRRGEHYVYKTHISCSTLMLIESSKDSLCFSVIHYMHPKQPHTVQAKTVDEKKLWAHHIKRLILENHQAVIPQKAKEAILEMDSIYKKFRYSPERLKRSACQSEDLTNSRQVCRQSAEPAKEILKTTKAILKPADGEGVLPAGSLEAAGSVSTLASDVSDCETPAVEEDDVETMMPSDNEEQASSLDTMKGGLMQEQEVEEEGNDSDDILMEDNQDEKGSEVTEKNFIRGNGTSLNQEQPHFTDDKYSQQTSEHKSKNLNITSKQGSSEKLKPDASSDTESLVVGQRVTASNEFELAVEKHDQEGSKEESSSPLQQDDTPGESSEEEEEDTEQKADSSSILPSSVLDKASAIAEHFVCNARRSSVNTEEVRSLGYPSPRLSSKTGSTLSLGDNRERPLRLASTCSEPNGTPLTQEDLASADFTIASPRDDCLFDSNQNIPRRRDSVLSRQDQLLIDKIRSYYENAEHQDDTFSLKRRESLSYIPRGLVRSSVSLFNSVPNDNNLAPEVAEGSSSVADQVYTPAIESSLVPSALSEPNMNVNVSALERSALSPSTDSGRFDKTSDLFNYDVDNARKPQSANIQLDKEFFRPSSEMIKVWQDMEQEVTRGEGDLQPLRPRETTCFGGASPSLSKKAQNPGKNTDGGSDPDLGTITEESSTPSPPKETGKVLKHTVSEIPRSWEDEGMTFRPLAPRVIQLRAEAEDEKASGLQSEEDPDSAQNKVFHLARKYSQRIKCTQPVLRVRSQDSGDAWLLRRNLLSVVDEKPEEAKRKPNLTLSFTSNDKADRDQKAQFMTSPINTPSSTSSPKILSPRQPRSRSPLSPTTSENFNWPDVRELCSKYAHLGSSSVLPLASRKFDSGSKRRSSCTPSFLNSNGISDSSTRKSHSGRETDSALTPRGGSLDRKLGDLYLSDINNFTNVSSGYYISAQATLPNEKNIIVIEKIPGATSTTESKRQEIKTAGTDDSYVQIRSPTSREKLSFVAVFDRCRAYQESEEHHLREEVGGSRAEQLPKIERHKELEKSPASYQHLGEALKNAVDSGKKADASQQSVVKNLREKFQNLR